MNMRNIKFRGKDIKTGKWIYGDLVNVCNSKNEYVIGIKNTPCHVNNKKFDLIPDVVIPETVGEYTGLKDKHGKEVYEGDILNIKTSYKNNMLDKRFQNKTIVIIKFKNGSFVDDNTSTSLAEKIYFTGGKTNYEIIGNICENPELLEV